MPLSNFARIGEGKVDSGDCFSLLNGFSYGAGHDLSELVWENGQVTVQGQSSKTPYGLSSGNQSEGKKVGNLQDIALQSSEMDMCLNNELAPWLDYTFDEDYGSQRLNDVMGNGLSGQSGCDLGAGNAGEKGTSFLYKPYTVWSSQNRQTPSGSGSGVLNNISNQMEVLIGNDGQNRDMLSECRHKMVNFPHFLKPNVVVPVSEGSNSKKNITDVRFSAMPEAVSSCVQELGNEDVRNAKLDAQRLDELVPAIVENVACSSVGSGHDADVVSNDQTKRCKRKSRDTDDSGSHDDDIDVEYVGEKMADPPRQGSVSEISQIVEVDGKKSAPPRKYTKRNRVAEVHNLSERKRRDRINEKMKALQELIPNCNKADKASMLGEAIEYLKMLQFQVQFMSMGGGVCMQPMVFPQGMQPMYPHFGPFPQMGVGFGVGRSSIFPTSVTPNMFPVYGHPCQATQTSEHRQQQVAPISQQTVPVMASSCTSSVVLNTANKKTSSKQASAAVASRESHQVASS